MPSFIVNISQNQPTIQESSQNIDIVSVATQGPAGQSGNKILSGTIDPIQSQGNIGDFYLNTSTKYLFGSKTSSGWGSAIYLSGNRILVGTVDPVISDGVDGDLFLNTVTLDMFGPKATTWSLLTSLRTVVPPETMMTTTYDPQGIAADVFDLSNHTGQIAPATISAAPIVGGQY